MDEFKERAERLRAMREAASSTSAEGPSMSVRPTPLPAPFVDLGHGEAGARGGFYTGNAISADDSSHAAPPIARRAPPPPPPPRRERAPEFAGGGRGGRGRKVARTEREHAIDPAAYYKVREITAIRSDREDWTPSTSEQLARSDRLTVGWVTARDSPPWSSILGSISRDERHSVPCTVVT